MKRCITCVLTVLFLLLLVINSPEFAMASSTKKAGLKKGEKLLLRSEPITVSEDKASEVFQKDDRGVPGK